LDPLELIIIKQQPTIINQSGLKINKATFEFEVMKRPGGFDEKPKFPQLQTALQTISNNNSNQQSINEQRF